MLATPEPISHLPAESMGESSSQILGPPFSARWLFDGTHRQFFWNAWRAPLTSGHLVAQVGVRQTPPHPYFARFEVGFQKRFTAQASGLHRVTVQIDSGPITRLNGAGVSAFAFMDGVRRQYTSLHSYRTSYVPLVANLDRGQKYTVVSAGLVTALAAPGRPDPYGEIIASVPRITVFKVPHGLDADLEKYIEARNAQIDELGDVRSVAAAMAQEEGAFFDGTSLDLDQALREEAAAPI